MTLTAEPESPAPSFPARRATGVDSSPASVALAASLTHFGTARGKFYTTCKSKLADSTPVSAVVSSPDEGGIRGQGRTTRLALLVHGVPRYTIEYARHQSNGTWILDAARYTLHDETGRRIAHGLYQRNGSSLASLSRRIRTGGVADATTIVPVPSLVALGRSTPAFLTDDEIAETFCAAELANAAMATSNLMSYSLTFGAKSLACLTAIGKALADLFSGDWGATLPDFMQGVPDCVAARDAYGSWLFWTGQATIAATALTNCIAEHSTMLRIIGETIIPGEDPSSGGDQWCGEWELGYYDENFEWVVLDSWTECYMM